MRNAAFALFFMVVSVSGTSSAVQPTDPLVVDGSQWHLRPFPAWVGASGPDAVGLDLPGAWAITKGTAYVGVPDNGIQISTPHPELHANGRDAFSFYRPQFAWNVLLSSSNVDELSVYAGPSRTAGHGSHVAGLLAATTLESEFTYPQAPERGAAGVCWRCSGIIVKAADPTRPGANARLVDMAAATRYALNAGAQIISVSVVIDPANTLDLCGLNPRPSDYVPWCQALDLASDYDVLVVASAGNNDRPRQNEVPVSFPASDPRSLAVGGITKTGARWSYTPYGELPTGSNQGDDLTTHGVVAPAADVISTVYTGEFWTNPGRCGDSWRGDEPLAVLNSTGSWINTPIGSGNPTDGYGACTGNSMAAPQVAGIVALMRTVNPLHPAPDVRSALLETASDASCANAPANAISGAHGCSNASRGHGVPSARKAVERMRDHTNPNLLTPLFALRSGSEKYFYTVVPQMARAAVLDTLLPKPSGARGYFGVGSTVRNPAAPGTLYVYPGSGTVATAQFWVHSTHRVPGHAGDLVPLYRLSRLFGNTVDHAYETNYQGRVKPLLQAGYQIDGIEGYLYPVTGPKPYGTTAVMRASKFNGSDFAVFPESAMGQMSEDLYRYNVEALGFAFLNDDDGNRPGSPQAPVPGEVIPLAPFMPYVEWAGCYGRHNVYWAPNSGNEEFYTLQKRTWGTPATAWVTAYQGPLTVMQLTVSYSTDVRVRACNWLGCSAWSYGPALSAFSTCPNP